VGGSVVLGEALLLGALLLLSAFWSGSETALTALSRINLARIRRVGGRGADAIVALLDRPGRLLVTVLFGNTLVNIWAASVATLISLHLFEPEVLPWTGLVMTLLLLVFGEITPKTYAVEHAEGVSRLVAPPILLFSVVITPIRWLLQWVTDRLARPLLKGVPEPSHRISPDEFETLLTVGYEQGAIDSEEHAMISNVLALSRRKAADVMTAVSRVFSFPPSLPIAAAALRLRTRRLSRVPLVEPETGKFVGFVRAIDVLSAVQRGGGTRPVSGIRRRADVVSEFEPVSALLSEFRSRRRELAVVVDEFGEVSGILTLHDLLEEVTGEILEEPYREPPSYRWIDERTLRVAGDLDVEELARLLGLDLDFGDDVESVGGIMIDRLGDIPEEGVEVEAHGLRLRASRADERRVIEVDVTKPAGGGAR
jgi:CBS domain containing-hemolysin-like protein